MGRAHHDALKHCLPADQSGLFATFQCREQLHRRQKTQDLPPTLHKYWMSLRGGTTPCTSVPQKPLISLPQSPLCLVQRKILSTCCDSPRLRNPLPLPTANLPRRGWSPTISARFLSPKAQLPRPFFRDGALLWRVIAELSGKSEQELSAIYRSRGDAGLVAADALPARAKSLISLADVQSAFTEIAAASGPAAKAALLRQLLTCATPLAAQYIVKIISGDLRIGLKESLVEEAIAKAFHAPLDQVKRANMLLGDIGETLRLASAGKLADAQLRLFNPIDFMFASPVESAEEAASYFDNAAVW